MSRDARAQSAGSTEGWGKGHGLFRSALASDVAPSDASGTPARSHRWRGALLATLTVAMIAFAATPAFGEDFVQSLEPPVAAYTSVQLKGFVENTPNSVTDFFFQYSTDGVNFKNLHPDSCPPGSIGNPAADNCLMSPNAPSIPFDTTFGTVPASSPFHPGTQYFFRLLVDRQAGFGKFFSNVVTATTLPVAAPSVLSIDDANEVSFVTAQASGVVKGADGPEPGNSHPDFDANCRFEYVTDARFAETGFELVVDPSDLEGPGIPTAPCNVNPVVGSSEVPVEANLTGLKPDTTYHLRLVASNSGGSDAKTAASTFTTLPVTPPSALSINDATDVGFSRAEVAGKIERPFDPGSDPAFDAQCRFEYVSDADYLLQNEVHKLVIGATGGTFTLNFNGKTTFAVPFNSSPALLQEALEGLPGIGVGNVTVSGGPGDATGTAPYTITFGGALAGKVIKDSEGSGIWVNSGSLAGMTKAQIEVTAEGHPQENFNRAASTPCEPEVATEPGETEVKATLTGLAVGTTYHLRLVAFNPGGSDAKEAASTFTTLVPGAPIVSILPPTDVTATSAHFTGEIDPDGTDPSQNVSWHFQCTPACPGLEGTVEADGLGTRQVSAEATGLKANTNYEVSLVAANLVAQATAGPETFTTGAVKPVVTTFSAFALAGGTQALVGGKVDPENSATKYWVEYGADEGYGGSIPLTQDAGVGSGDDPTFVTQEVSGLQPSTTYHFRLVANNAVGTVQGADKTFTTAPAGGLGSSIGSTALPDGRAWEMVSPVDKNRADIWKSKAQASASGNALSFQSQGSFAGQPTAKGGLLSDYISRRGADSWGTNGISPPGGSLDYNDPGYHEFCDDLESGRLKRKDGVRESLDPEFKPDPNDLGVIGRFYFRDFNTGKYRIQPDNFVTASKSDLSHLVIQTGDTLTPDGCFVVCVYEKVGGELRLASKMPNGEFAFGQFSAISKDGSRIYWTDFEGHAYVRVDGSSTLKLDESERATPPVGGAAAASVAGIEAPRGEKALLVTPEELVDADEDFNSDLYVWDGTKPLGERLTLVSQGDAPGVEVQFGGVLGNGDDRLSQQSMQRGYFTADNQVLTGEPSAPGQKIYFWEADGTPSPLSYVATVPDGSLQSAKGPYANVHTSPDGRYLAFASSERLTAYDNNGKQEIYRYDGAVGQLVCISCEPKGRPATASAAFNSVPAAESSFILPHILRNVSDNGRAFFETAEGLVPRDSNHVLDVYEFSDGAPHLISSGRDSQESRFLDASVSGDDVFFATSQGLVGWDHGDDVDAYDARVGGGLPEPPPPVIGCDGDACQPPPTPPNDPTPASSTFNGAGNASKKAAHKKKRHQAHKKKRQKKRQHSRNSARKNG